MWPEPPSHCLYASADLMNGTTVVFKLCNQRPEDLSRAEATPLIAASAPHLSSLCRNGSPLLGVGQRVRMRVRGASSSSSEGEGEEATYVIICDAARTGMTMGAPGVYDSWRVVTIVSEKDVVDPLLSGIVPAAVKVGAAGAAAALAAIVAALAISVYVQRRSKCEEADDGGALAEATLPSPRHTRFSHGEF